MEEFYIVPLEQAKKGRNICDIATYAGYSPLIHANTLNNAKRLNKDGTESSYEINLIVSCNKENGTATELLTGIEIPVINVYILEDGTVTIPQITDISNDNEKLINLTSMYIVNRIVRKDNKGLSTDKSLTFTQENNLALLELHDAAKVLENYKYFYAPVKTMRQILKDQKAIGKDNAVASIEEQLKDFYEKEELNKKVRKLFNELKKHS